MKPGDQFESQYPWHETPKQNLISSCWWNDFGFSCPTHTTLGDESNLETVKSSA